MQPQEEPILLEFVDSMGVPLPPGTKAVPRPPDRPRLTGPTTLSAHATFQSFEDKGVELPPGTPAQPRPPGQSPLRSADAGQPPSTGGTGPANGLHAREAEELLAFGECLRQAFPKGEEWERLAFQAFLQGASPAQIAGQLQIPEPTVTAALCRHLRTLRNLAKDR